ncbi:hypothetical protein BD560DRAFT_445435 [Blakeslea trispora]|nr:hypothetical protein BD560DRAFT_445435 [Blakeslea trispora]
MTSFPKGWLFIKNLNSGYVLTAEKSTAGEPVLMTTIKSRDADSQLWQHGEDGRLHNKKTGLVLDVSKGSAKVGAEIVQQHDSDSSTCQTFGLSVDGHIYLTKDPSLVLGIKESFFTRRDGQHVHLQKLDKNVKERKEQRWEFMPATQKRTSILSGSMHSLKRTISGASLGSFSSASLHHHQDDEDTCLDESNQMTSFPDHEFFIKSESTGYFIGVEFASSNSSGARIFLSPLRKNDYETQLWHYDVITGRLINKASGFALTAEEVLDEASIRQSSSITEKDLSLQSWIFANSGEIKLKSDHHYVLGFKKDNWFGLNRDSAALMLQKQTDHKTHSYQRFVIVAPIFKKKTTEITTVTEQIGVFPEGHFFIKNQKHDLVITVLETEKLAAQIVATKLDPKNFNRQLWSHKDGFLINKESNLVLDVRGGCIVDGTELCQYKQKKEGFENQQWGLSPEGYIHSKIHKDVVLAISSVNIKDRLTVRLADKKTPDHSEQRWNFVLPVFKQVSTSVPETTVQKKVHYHNYAQYPSGWFFIRSFAYASPEAPLVLTADSVTEQIHLQQISKENWRNQLWMYWNGVLINFATQLAIDVENDNLVAGSSIRQELRKAGDIGQRWRLTVEGYLIHGSNPSLTLVPRKVSDSDSYDLVLEEYLSVQQEYRWSLLAPEIKVENNTQVLVRWTVSALSEWKQFSEKVIQKVVHRVANWPEDTFFLTAQGNLALVPEKPEAFAFLTLKKLELGESSEHFKWTFRDGCLTHVTTGLVLHAADDLVGGSLLQIRNALTTESNAIDQRQSWAVMTDGSIVSQSKKNLGLTLIQHESGYQVQLAYSGSSYEHYAWGFARGHYETRYSDIYKKEIRYMSRTERVLLTLCTHKFSSMHNTKKVTHSYGVFPDSWFYICSKADKSLVLTAPSKKEGAKLVLQKLDYKIFRRQLWHVEDDGCLINLESDYVIDVAGGAIESGSDIIQWHQKFLKRHRKNQLWSLSVDGHIHPKDRPNYVLGPKDKNVSEGSEIQLYTRGSLDLSYQQWAFAVPRFGKIVDGVKGVSTSPGALIRNTSGLFVEEVDDTSVNVSTMERYERAEKYTVVRRWGTFPEGGFFIRANCGDEHLALTVEQKARVGENGSTEHEVLLRPINFKRYKWQFWTYENGYLINAQTGLALDATIVKGVLLEDGLRNPLFVREKSMSDHQFWSLTANGEIHLRSDERLVIGVSNSSRIQVSGAQVGLRQLSVRKFINEKGQRETTLKSEQWLRWVFSKPVYRTTTITTTTSTETTSNDSDEIQGLDDQKLNVKEAEESSEDVISDDSDDSDSEDEDDDSASLSELSVAEKTGIVAAGASILDNAVDAANKVTETLASAPQAISNVLTKNKDESKSNKTTQVGKTKKTFYNSLKFDRKESFRIECDYVPTGFERIVRYKTHTLQNFPMSGYFFIKSYLHGMVLDVVDGDTRDGAYVVLAPMKSTNFASQLWSYREGRVVNLKGHNLVLDATMTDTIVAGERLVISTRITGDNVADQQWELGTDGLISLKSKPDLVLGVKEVKRVSDQNTTINVYLQEEKAHLTGNIARPEQRWEIKIPALIPAEQTSSSASTDKFTIIEAGKISAISSCISAIAAFGCLKQTFQHKITSDNQWPSSQNWFLISADGGNAFLSSGNTDSAEVGFVKLSEQEDHKQYMWTYINGYLINYKYMLRLIYDKNSHKLMLSGNNETLNQTFYVSSRGVLHVKIHSEVIYFSVAYSSHNERRYQLITTDHETTESKPALQLHIPVFSNHEIEKESKVALSTVISWMITSQKSSTTTTTTTVQKYGLFPHATWFFVKVNSQSTDSLVLAVKDSSTSDGAFLTLKKLSFKDYRSQLWTYRSGVLINYGSKLVIDVEGQVDESAKLIQTAEAGVSSQKWSLTADGRIYLDSYAQYTLGFTSTEAEGLTEDTLIQLVSEGSSDKHSITWKFSVPIFGKATITGSETTVTSSTTVSTVSSVERLSASIEANALIESIEEADIEVEDISVKKNNALNNNVSSAVVADKEKHHSFQEILTNVGIATATTAAAVGIVEGASKIADKVSKHHQEKAEEKKQTSSSVAGIQVENKQDNVSSVSSDKKATEKITVQRSKQTSVQIIEESRMITRAWKITFSQRIRRCKTREELVQTVEECREDLFRRLDEHLRVHASLEHLVVGSVPEWHVSVHQIKELYRARVFEKFLGRLQSGEATDLNGLDFDSTITTASQEAESHYQLVIENVTKKTSSEQTQSSSSTDVVSSTENILVTVDSIKVTVRYWLINLYETVHKAKNSGSSDEEINSIIENSRKELSQELTQIKSDVSNQFKQSSTTLSSKQTSVIKTVEAAIDQTEGVMSTHIGTVCSQKQYLVDEEHWLDVTRIIEEKLSTELQVYQAAVTQDIVDVQKTMVKKEDKAELSVVLDEKMIGVAQQTVSNKLLETQTKISSWFIQTTQQIELLIQEGSESSEESVKQDAMTIIDAAQVEVNTRIEEAKLVLRAYYAHLTYLSWAERRRLEYSLDNIKASITANIYQFKKSVAHSEVSKHQIVRYLSYSFGANASRIVLSELQSIVTKVVNVKKTTSVVNKTQEIEGENNKLTIVGDNSSTKITEVKKTTETTETTQPAHSSVDNKTQVTKTEDVKQVEKSKTDQGTKIVDTIETEVEQTKVSKVNNKPSASSTVLEDKKEATSSKTNAASSAALGAAAAALANITIFHHHDAEKNKQQESLNTTKHTDKVDDSTVEKDSLTKTTVEKKSDTLVVVYDEVHVVIRDWLVDLNKKVYECAQKKGDNVHQEIDSIIYESQQKLAMQIEKSKRNTTSIIGTSQTSFHSTLSWVRSTVWKQVYEIKQIGYEIATATEVDHTHFEQKLESVKETTLQKVDSALEKAKTSASVIHKVGHESSATIAAGKKFEGADYSKTSYGESVEKTKVVVGILIEDTRLTIQDMFRKLSKTVIERRKQGGSNVEADISVIFKKHQEEINAYILKSKTEIEKRINSADHTSSECSKVDAELQVETIKKVQYTLEQVQASVTIQVSKIEKIATSTVTSETEYDEQLYSITHETCEKIDSTLAVSETIIGHHIEVTAESATTHQNTIAEESSSSKMSLGVQYGLVVVSETTKNVSSHISALVERVHQLVIVGSESLEQDVHGLIVVSEKELDLILEEAKSKITYELSMVSAHEKVEEKHFLESLEAIRRSTRLRIAQVNRIATSGKEEVKTTSEKLLQIAEESRHEIKSHLESVSHAVTTKAEKVVESVHGVVTPAVPQTQENTGKTQKQKLEEDHHSKTELAKKMLKGTAGVAVGTAIAVEIGKKLSEHKKKEEQLKKQQEQAAAVIADVKVQFNKWLSTLTETVVSQTKQSTISTEEITVTVEKSKTEFLEIIKTAKSNQVIVDKYQHDVLSWIEETASAQATRIQEIAVASSTSAAVDVKSRLEVIKLSTTQEVEVALEKCKQTKSSVSTFVGASIDKLKQKEAALLDIQSELTMVTESVQSTLTIYFQKFTKSVILRLEQGGDNVEKDIALLISNSRKEVAALTEDIKNSAAKRLSALETKSTVSVVSTAALSGVATAEVIKMIKFSEDLIMQRINRVHSSVWYIEKDQDITKITETISTITKETVTEITQKFESSKHEFVCSVNDHHSCGHIAADITENVEQSSSTLNASLSIHEVKITIREWLKRLTEKVSTCSQSGKSSDEIELIVKKETDLIYSYLDQSTIKIKETLQTEESIKSLDIVMEQVKTTTTKASTEIKMIGIDASTSTSHNYGGFDKMASVVIEHEQTISQTLVTYESKISSKTKKQSKQQVTSGSQANQQQKVGKDIYKVIATEYTLSIIHKWFEELMVDVSELAKHEHDFAVVSKDVESTVFEAKEYINAELSSIVKKIQVSKADSSAKQELINIIEWTRGMLVQSASQVQSIGINSAVAFSSTGGIEQMKPLVAATENQINVAIGRCNKTLEIEVESNSIHYEKKKAKSECIKQEIKKKADCANEKKKKESKLIKKAKQSKSDSESSSDDSDAKKKCEKNKKTELKKKHTEESSEDDTSSSEDESKKQKKSSCVDKKKVVAGIIAGGAIVKHALDQSSSDSETDSETEKQTTVVDKKKLKTGQSSLDVTIIVREWYEKLITDVSNCAKQRSSSVNSDIEVIVQKAVSSITETLRIISVNAHKTVADTTTVQQYQNSIEWVKNLVIQSSYQLKAIGINCAAASSKTGGIEQMRPIAVSIQDQINVEIRRYKLIIEKTESAEVKKNTQVNKIEHKENQEKVQVGRLSACDRKEYCDKLEKHVSGMVNESKITFNSWFSEVVREVSVCVHQGGDSVEEDVKALLEKSRLELERTIKQTQTKFASFIGSSEKDKTALLIKSHFYESLELVQTTVTHRFEEIHRLVVERRSETESSEKLLSILQSSKTAINESFESGYKQTVSIISQELHQTESTVKVIDTVEEIKIAISQWHSKLNEEIHSISIDSSIENKEERIHTLVEQATLDVERITKEAKTKVTENCTSVKKISKSKEQELLLAIDHAHETFNTDVKKIQEVSIEAIKKSDANIKHTVSSVVESSKEKIDSALTKTAAAVIGTATAAMAVHAIKKHNKAEEKKTEKKHNELSVGVDQNVVVISQWLELFVKNVTESVRVKQENAIEKVTRITEQAEQEISEMITVARTDFIKRLSHQSLDQEAYDFACKHYEESLETVRVTIISEIVEVKKAAIHAHSTGNIQEFETHVTKLTTTSNERIKAAMGSSAVLKHKIDANASSSKKNEAQVQIEFDSDDVMIGEEEVEFERKESVVNTHKEEKIDKTKTEQVKDKKKDSSVDKILAVGTAAGAAGIVSKKNDKMEIEKQKVKQDIISTHQHLKYDSGVTTIESVNVLISAWFTLLIQRVSTASKSGASSQKITTIVEESRSELIRIVEHAKSYGSKYCATANDEQQYISKIEWAASVAHNQATQIQQIGINASASKSDLTKQMEALATASYHQIEVTLEQMKTSIKFHQKVNKINSNKTQTAIEKTDSVIATTDKPVCGKMETTVDKTKVAYTVIQEIRVTTITIFVSLYERIVCRIRQGGSSLQEDVCNMIEASEHDLQKVFNEAKATSSKVDKKTRTEIEQALSSVQKTVREQINEIKTVSVEAVSHTTTDSKLAIEKVLESSKQSKSKIESTFTIASESITASLIVVSKTAKEATTTVQGWFTSLKRKISDTLEASDCSEQEKQTKVNELIVEAETEMKTKIEKLQQTAAQTKKTSTTTEVTADHHLDIFFSNVKSSVQNQLETVKNAVSNTSNKSKIISALEKSETKLKQEVGIHCEAVEKIANVDHITGVQQKVTTEAEKKNRHDAYKSTIEKAATGAVAVAAAAAIAIDHHKKNQQSQATKVQVVKEYSLKDVQTKIDRWFAQLTDRVTAVTKKGGNNVTVEVNQIIKEAQSELEVTINEFKSQHAASESYSTTTETKRTFTQTLEWIKTTTLTQTTQISEIVSHSSSSSIDLSTQIQNYVSATKQQVSTALEIHFENASSITSTVDQSKVTHGQAITTHEQTKATENTIQIVKETRQQTQKRFQLETTVIVQESKTKITNWLVLLLSDITTIIHGNSETIRKDILTKLDTAEREIDVMIKEIKNQFLSTTKTSATSQVEMDTQTLVINSVKQTLDCVDSIRTVLALQLSVVREVITRIEVEDVDIITERLEAVVHRTQTRVSHTLETGVDMAISCAFDGKVVTWSETATIPASFKGVRAIAFDLAGTVADYHKHLYQVWKKVIESKHDAVLSSLQFNNLVIDWYETYANIKRENFMHKRFVSDEGCLYEALVRILQRYYIKDSFDDSEIKQLCRAWKDIGVHDDVSFGIRRLKNQSLSKYATVAISDTFSTGTMVKLAQNNCLCWHAQFSADMFASSSQASASESVVKGTIQLLGLEQAHELAVVSSDYQLVTAAKAQGCHAVLVEREDHSSHVNEQTIQYDIKVDGLDVFGESVQSFLEHDSMTKVWNEKQAPSAPRVWVPKVKGTLKQ